MSALAGPRLSKSLRRIATITAVSFGAPVFTFSLALTPASRAAIRDFRSCRRRFASRRLPPCGSCLRL